MDSKNESTIINQDIAHDHAPETTHDQGELAELHTKIEELNDQLLRALAENQNLRRRLQKEIEDTHQYAIGKFAGALLAVADNFDRALSLISDEVREDEKFKNFISSYSKTFTLK
jgi:molecular chaperone GrpE